MKEFEYKAVTVEADSNHQLEKDLNALADHGWELVGYSEPAPGKVRLILKRKILGGAGK
jgi:hypothetical protein